uniref:PIPK domain-containing protein n=1 Tax=Kwoniella bestiolae CBS 10118 TaxID=1296100 RepID=A0A1B9GB77_9TREE|nr:hypothetical protein I302_03133 [Kwoniella bestiolae CBS 10118]OCF28277.1 hypothetical protein I302_03133 [Kwoniella bestiolae CBS 10118]
MSSPCLPVTPSSLSKPLPKDPFPPRSTSPPLPPRKNVAGLPPTYLRHLRRLLHQWLEQQIRSSQDPSSQAGRKQDFAEQEPLWSKAKVEVLEKVIWEGAIVPRLSRQDGKKGKALLELDWAEYTRGAVKRKAKWKESQERKILAAGDVAESTTVEASTKGPKSGKQSRKGSVTEFDPAGKGRLTIPGSPLPPQFTSSTPSRSNSRPSSVASSSNSVTATPNPATPSHPKGTKKGDDESGDEEDIPLQEWCQIIRSLKGYTKLSLPKKDEWEVVEDDFPKYGTIPRDVPGAFPQSSFYEYRSSSEDQLHLTASSSKTRFSDLGLPTPTSLPNPPQLDTELLKPVFCLHFPSPGRHQEASSSTLRLKRDNSLGKKSVSSVDSDGGNKKWWSGSGGRWSEMTIGPKSEVQPEFHPEIEFAEGQFALPSHGCGRGTWRQGMLKKSSKKRISVFNSFSGSPESSTSLHEDASSTTSSTETDQSAEGNSSIWSGTEKGFRTSDRGGLSLIITGLEDDIPRKEAEQGEIGIVGGTLVVRGVQGEEEQIALQRVLQLLIYTIQSMMVELELLDAFRIPREPDEPPLPPKLLPGTASVPHSPTKPRGSVGLQRKGSHKERGEKSKGFFHRLGKDTKHVWEGFLGKRRSSVSHEQGAVTTTQTINQSPELPITPLTGGIPQFEEKGVSTSIESSTSGLPAKSHTPHPTERYITVLSKLEQQVHSTTPGLQLPMPPLLLRVREEDKIRREKAKQEANEEPGQTVDGLPTSPSLFSPSKLLNNNNKTLDPLHGRALNYRLGGDVRAGLGALSRDIDNFEGWIRLQRLESLRSVGLDTRLDNGERDIHICQAPTPYAYLYWDVERDKSVQQILDDLKDELAEENMVCPRPGCTATSAEHVRWYIHAGKKVPLRVESLEEQSKEEGGIDVWSKCAECGKYGEARELNINAKSHSWGKLLEILIYTDILHPSTPCPHTSSTSHYFRTSGLVVSLKVEAVSILDTRLPKLQVGPNVTKRKGGKEPVTTFMTGILRKEIAQEKVEGLRNEINQYFEGLERRLDIHRDHALSKAESDQEGSPTANKEINQKSSSLDLLTAEISTSKVELLQSLAETQSSQINNVRRKFAQSIKSNNSKLIEWQKKHAVGESDFNDSTIPVPDYADEKGSFALPGSAVLVRLVEPASIIAYTLSLDYFIELTSTAKTTAATSDDGLSTSATVKSEAPIAEKSKTDLSSIDGAWSVEVKRRDTPRDLLSLRTITKKKSEIQLSQPPKHLLGLSLAPNAPSLELSLEQVEGKSQSSDRLGDLAKTISKATAQDPTLTLSSPSGLAKTLAASESDTDAMPRVRSSPRGMRRFTSDSERAAPPSAFRPTSSRSVSSTSITPSTPTSSRLATSSSAQTPGSTQKEGWGSMTSTFSNSFNQLLKIGSDVGESIGSIRVRGTDRSLSSLIGPLGMMATADNSLSSIDDRPHIQFSYTLGDRLKLGCTVYYATAFDSLRRRCAIDRSLIQSLSRTNAWDAQGGKSKAAFFMTTDKRYIVKELVSKWNVSDTHALLDIAPHYFEHLAGTHNKATSLAKIVGFYTVKINDLKTGTKRQMDLLVMENLFYKQTISRTYDLKGIEGRKVHKFKTVEGDTKVEIKPEMTLFDGEWLEGLQRGLVLLQPHAKRILQEAISLDTKFLSSQSIMDYSLLIGVDEGKHELVVGLVDAIGSYNLFKNIESRGKQALNRGGEVTIIPPDQYRDRFEHALKNYFIACPDKWSKPSRRSGLKRTVGVPSVL